MNVPSLVVACPEGDRMPSWRRLFRRLMEGSSDFAPPPLALCMMIAKWLTGRNKRWVCLAFDAHSRVQLRRLFRLF